MSYAKYTVAVPKVDALGNPLKDIAGVAHHYLATQRPFGFDHAYIDDGMRGQFPHDLVVVHAEETPEADSHLKQLGSFVGEMANHPTVHVTRNGHSGLATWNIANGSFRPGEPAEATALQMPHGQVPVTQLPPPDGIDTSRADYTQGI